MSLDADLIVDRRRMRRKLTFWRVLAIVVVILAVAAAAAVISRRTGFAGAYIARVTIQGLIRDDQERVQQLYDALMQLKEKKPLVIVVDGLAASGGYIAALAGDHIIAKQTSLVGSIGVLFQYPNVADLLGKIGVKVESIKSSPLKAAPDGFEPTSPEARAAIESIIKDSYAWFRGLVQKSRHLDDDQLQTVADGRVFTGHQAIGLKLIDDLGDEKTAIAWLASEKKVDAKLPVRDYRLHDRFADLPFLHAAAALLLNAAGFSTLAHSIDDWGPMPAVERLNLDGLLALWHPAGAN